MVWPKWVATITNISHLATTFNASVNFYIYFCKHYHTLMKRKQRSDENSRMVTIATTTRMGNFLHLVAIATTTRIGKFLHEAAKSHALQRISILPPSKELEFHFKIFTIPFFVACFIRLNFFLRFNYIGASMPFLHWGGSGSVRF